MNIQNFCEIFGEIREDYVLEARKPTQKAFFQNWRIGWPPLHASAWW